MPPTKTLKFKDHLAHMIIAGEKTSTWRLFDDKNLSVGDTVELINKDTGDVFRKALITRVYEKTLGTLLVEDYDGHEVYKTSDDLYKAYQSYYPDKEIGPSTVLKIVHFTLL